jgi:23S rRNA (cytosine1962-C5)-methyltransferase
VSIVRIADRVIALKSPAASNPIPGTGNAVVKVSSRGAARLRAGHPWIYRSDVLESGNAAPGAAVDVVDERGRILGTALYSSASQIALRLVSREPVSESRLICELLPQRLQEAVEYRGRVIHDTNAYRLVFSEADRLGGLIADRYNDIVTLQLLTQAFDREELRNVVLAGLRKLDGVDAIVERIDPRIRELEKLSPISDRILWKNEDATSQATEATTVFTMNGLRFHYDALAGQKTGAFLDQRENYAAVERYAHGEALDVFCYQGGFALHLARKCSQVAGVDSSRTALEAAEQNAGLNFPGRELEWIEANAFDLLRDYADAGRQYDTIVLDPPAFAKSKSALDPALRGYKELNLRALKMLRPGGVLATCSCSYHVTEADFRAVLASAAADAGRFPRLLQARGAAADHPAIITNPETAYLKCLLISI